MHPVSVYRDGGDDVVVDEQAGMVAIGQCAQAQAHLDALLGGRLLES